MSIAELIALLGDIFQQFTPLILLLCIAAFSGGFIDAIAGGGGLIVLPVLILTGVPVHQALAVNKLQSVFGTANACRYYIKQGYCSLETAKYAIAMTFVGALSGAWLVLLVAADNLRYLIPVLLVGIFIYLLWGGRNLDRARKPKLGYYSFYSIFGIALGFYDGFFGPGTGSLWMTMLFYFLGKDVTSALGQTKIMNVTSNLASLVIFSALGVVNYPLGLLMAFFQIVGSTFGAKLAIKRGARIIRPLLLLVVFATIIKVAFDIYLDI